MSEDYVTIGAVPAKDHYTDWRKHLLTKEAYDLAVGSGLAWIVFKHPPLPLTWTEAKKILIEEGIIDE